MKHFSSIILIVIFSSILNAGQLPAEKARGVFISFGVGPRLPVSIFGQRSDLGYGINLEISYTDNETLPFFVFGKIGFEKYPGSQDFYRISDYSNLSTTSIPVNAGIRYYFPPIMENVVLFMPILEVSAAYNYIIQLNQFKPASGRSNFTEEFSKFGASIGAGVSMFLMEILASYNYFESNQFISLDLKIRLPLYINF